MFVLKCDELEQAVGERLSISQLALRFECGKTTVRYLLGRYGLKTKNPAKRESSRELIEAAARGERFAVKRCPHHGLTTFVVGGPRVLPVLSVPQ